MLADETTRWKVSAMKHVLACFVAFSVAVAPISASAQFGGGQTAPLYLSSPSTIPYRGGRIGIAYELQLYQRNGVQFYRVTEVESASNFSGLAPGDFIYAVNGYYFRSTDDLRYLVGGYEPGTSVTVSYLDASRGMAAFQQNARLLAPAPANMASSRPLTTQDLDRALADTPTGNTQAVNSAQAQAALDRSLDAIVRSDARGWWTNHYDAGSMHGSHIRIFSPDGQTYTARGHYTYNGGSRGWVDARINNEQLVCIEYWDTWAGCRAPNRSGANSYAGVVVAGLILAVLAMAASGSGGQGSTAGSGWRDDDGSGTRRQSSPEEQRRNRTERIGGEGGLYGCASPPCWDGPESN